MPDSGSTEFGAFYRATVIPLRRYLARMLGNWCEAQDLAHDAYARIYAAFEGERIDAPRAFLFTTARRLALNQLQRRRIAPVREVDGKLIELAPTEAPGVERVVMARQEWARLEAAITALPPGCRSVLLLCKVEGLSHAEIGARLGIAVSTVEKQHARALRLLRAAVQDDAAADRGKGEATLEGDRATGL